MKRITITLTVDQAARLYQGAVWLLNEDEPKSAQAYDLRLVNKLAKAMYTAGFWTDANDPTGYAPSQASTAHAVSAEQINKALAKAKS